MISTNLSTINKTVITTQHNPALLHTAQIRRLQINKTNPTYHRKETPYRVFVGRYLIITSFEVRPPGDKNPISFLGLLLAASDTHDDDA